MSAAKSGASGPTDGSTDVENNDDRLERTVDMNMGRRRFCQAAGAVTVAAAAGVGTAAGATDLEPDFSSSMTPAPWVKGSTYTIAEHRQSSMGDLGYIDDEGNEVSLADEGAVVAPDDSDDDVTAAHNPVRIRADKFETGEYVDFPRGAKYDSDGDGDVDADDEDVRVVDATHWAKDTAGTAGTMTVEDATDDALRVSTSSQTSGDLAIASFDLSTVADEDMTITSGMSRKLLQSVVNVETLESGVVVTVAVEDSAGARVEAVLDPSRTRDDDDVIAAATGDGIAYQEKVGDLESAQSVTLADIQKVHVEVADANASVVFAGLNLERESQWSYGTREFVNADDEIETKTVREPAGYTGILSTDGLDDTFGGATVRDVEVDVWFQAADLPSSNYELRVEDEDRLDRPKRYEFVGGFEFPTGYDLSPVLGSLYGEVRHPDSRYVEVGISTTEDEVPTLEDVDDDTVEWTSRTADFEGGSIEDELELSSTLSGDSVTAFYFDLNVEKDEASSMAREAGGGGAPAFDESGGGFLSSVQGMVMAALLGVAGFLGALKAGFIGGGN